MAQAGDTYKVHLKETHLKWGEYRRPTNRNIIQGEGYIPIPRAIAERFNIYNSNNPQCGFGYNKFYASSDDGFLNNVILLAQGSSESGDVYAKQFSVEGNLRMIGRWYEYMNATVDSTVKVTWTDPYSIILQII